MSLWKEAVASLMTMLIPLHCRIRFCQNNTYETTSFHAALLRAGLVDEIDVATLPGLIGGVGTPSIMDGSPLTGSEVPIPLELISCDVHEMGFVRTRYRVVNTTGPKAT